MIMSRFTKNLLYKTIESRIYFKIIWRNGKNAINNISMTTHEKPRKSPRPPSAPLGARNRGQIVFYLRNSK
jgi:hypothetical protein